MDAEEETPPKEQEQETDTHPSTQTDKDEGEKGEKLLQIKRAKRAAKIKLTKLRHAIEKLCVIVDSNPTEIESRVEQLWLSLEESQMIMDDLSQFYLCVGDQESYKGTMNESDAIEKEIIGSIEKAQTIITARHAGVAMLKDFQTKPHEMQTSSLTNALQSESISQKDGENQPAETSEDAILIDNTGQKGNISETSACKTNECTGSTDMAGTDSKTGKMNSRLKPLKVPTFNGEKSRFEDFWALFESLVDCSNEPVNIKMARLRQSLTGPALESIRGLGVSSIEYNEAKDILQSKFGGQRRQLRAYMDQLEQMPYIRFNAIEDFERFADLVRITVVKLQADQRQGELGAGSLHSLLVKKLSDRHIEMYGRWMRENDREQSVLNLRDWLKEEARVRVEALEMAHGIQQKFEPRARNDREKPRVLATNVQHPELNFRNRNGPQPCTYCSGTDHQVWKCEEYRKLPVDERWKTAKEKRLCFRCLGANHQGKHCRRAQRCEIRGCQLSHHSLLHENKQIVQPQATTLSTQAASFVPSYMPREGVSLPTSPVTMTTCNTVHSKETLSLRTIPVWVKANGKKVKLNAVLDDASNETFLNEEIAAILGIQEPYEKVKVHVLNDTVETFQSMPLKVWIESVNGQFGQEINVRTCPQQVTGTYQVENWEKHKTKWPQLSNCDFPAPAKSGLVDLLIGVDNANLHFSKADIRTEISGPVARLGPLGWTCIGPPDGNRPSNSRSHVVRTFFTKQASVLNSGECCEIDQSLKRFWEIDSSGTHVDYPKVMTEDESFTINCVRKSLKYEDNRYTVAVPWKENKPKLPNNYNMAINRLRSTEKKLESNSFIAQEYQKTIEEYEQKGYLRKVLQHEAPPPEVWYLPHFPIVRMDKATTKVRIVFDCSAKCNGISLNDVIHSGPKLQRDLFDVLLRFRRNPVALACDIKEMYLQINIVEEDRPYFRILWRDLKSDETPQEYEFSRVVFGKNSAPMEAQFVSQENARKHKDQYPLAAETILESTYMDDSIDSVEDGKKGVELYHQLKELWGIAGMNARKWVSNSPEVMSAIPVEDHAAELSINGEQEPKTKTLGITWNSTDDVFTIPTAAVSLGLQITKRIILKKIATIFDPLGFVSPFIIVAKTLLQELWSRGYDWDEPVVDELANRISLWVEQLSLLEDIKVPRCLRESSPILSTQMVTFVDASTIAYGAVTYLRQQYEDNSVTCRMIASKSRVAPLSPMTVPRLELMGAILGLRLSNSIVKVLQISIKDVLFYSDSMDILWWIRGRGRDFRPFVANRIGEIQSDTQPRQWHHVPTDQNPADMCSRGVTAVKLANSTLWWNGPHWLKEDKSEWPTMKIEGPQPPTCEEKLNIKARKMKTTLLVDHRTAETDRTLVAEGQAQVEWRLEPKRFSSWTRLVHIYGRVKRVLDNMRLELENRTTDRELQPEEIAGAEEEIIKKAQMQTWPEEFKALTKKKELPKNSPLTKLNPRVDENGLIRSQSRLMFAEFLPYDTKFPIILPRGSWVTKLIVKRYHEMANHAAGVNYILAQLNKRYWVIAAREEITEWEKNCNECKKRKNKTASQVMAPLPQVRLRFTCRPFDQTAVDFAGPFTTIQGRGIRRHKRYLCLFTCLSVRAVHLEMAWGLDTDSFLNAFTRFVSRRGVPKEVVSDNGSNFVGAVNELKALHAELDKEKIQQFSADKGTKWIFNPPAAPHFGGAHEIMVKAAKKAIYGVLGNSDITDEELTTVFSGSEALLNSRPLTYQSADPRDDVPLTPNHFLHGQMGGDFAPETELTHFSPRNRWRKVQNWMSRVWQRWMTECLPALRTRSKWHQETKNLKLNDVVLVVDPSIPRGRWQLGRITDTYPGRDGHTRVVKVQCGDKAYVRPIHKLIPLDICD